MFTSILNKIEVKLTGLINIKSEQSFLLKNDFTLTRDIHYIHVKSDHFNLKLRKKGSDWEVFKQIFRHKEYEPLVKTLMANEINPEFILDLGSNIGLAAVFMKKHFPNAEIICIEPDAKNFSHLMMNICGLENINAIHAAIWNKSVGLTEDEPFRGGDDWSKTYKESVDQVDSEQIKGLTIADILQQYGKTNIDVLKMDIEGAERYIFDESISDLSFLSITNVIAIEIHDEFNIREKIYKQLRNFGFLLFEAGELTIGIKIGQH